MNKYLAFFKNSGAARQKMEDLQTRCATMLLEAVAQVEKRLPRNTNIFKNLSISSQEGFSVKLIACHSVTCLSSTCSKTTASHWSSSTGSCCTRAGPRSLCLEGRFQRTLWLSGLALPNTRTCLIITHSRTWHCML